MEQVSINLVWGGTVLAKQDNDRLSYAVIKHNSLCDQDWAGRRVQIATTEGDPRFLLNDEWHTIVQETQIVGIYNE